MARGKSPLLTGFVLLITSTLIGCATSVANAQETAGPGSGEGRVASDSSDHEGSLLLLPPTVSGQVWFANELEPIGDAVAEALSLPPLGYRVIPPQELRALWSRVRLGELPGVALLCNGGQPEPNLLTNYLYRDARETSLQVSCGEADCMLLVSIRTGMGEYDLVRYRLALPADEDPTGWAKVIRSAALERLPPLQREGGFGCMGPRRKKELFLYRSNQTGGWSEKFDRSRFRDLVDSYAACEQEVMDRGRQQFVLEVDSEGRVSRCEHPSADRLMSQSFQCKCDVLRTVHFGEGPSGRRAELTLGTLYPDGSHQTDPDGLFRHASLSDVKATDPSTLLGAWVVDPIALNDCAASVARPRRRAMLSLRLEVGPDGRIRSQSIEKSPLVPDQVSACISKVFETARLKCPLTGESVIEAKIRVAVEEDPASMQTGSGG